MTDYLEELLSGADVLLSQIRQLESGLVGRKNVDFEAEIAHINQNWNLVDDKKGNINPRKQLVYKREPGHLTDENEQTAEAEWQEEVFPLEENGRHLERPALLDQLEQMERMSIVVEQGLTVVEQGITTARRMGKGGNSLASSELKSGSALFGDFSAPEGGWTAGFRSPQAEPQTGGVLDWAERADRVFRRDSRRYDGGFCLY